MSKPTVTRDTKSASWIIDFHYLDEHGVRQRYRKSAGKGVDEQSARKRARELHRTMERDRRVFVEVFVQAPSRVEAVAFSGLAARWYDEHVAVKLSPTTQRTHEQIVRVHLVPYFGDRDARGITQADILSYRAEKTRAGLSPKSVNNHLSVLHTLFDFARSPLAVLSDNPVPKDASLRVDNRGHAYLTREENESYLASVAATDPTYLPALMTALRAGLRQGELVELRWHDVDLGARVIVVSRSRFKEHVGPTKGNRERRVPMSPHLAACLAAHRPIGAQAEDLVFRRADGAPLNGDILKHPHRRAAIAIGRPRLRFHDLRHSFASELVQAGAPLNVVQALLGHSEVETTLRYAHLAPDTMARWVEKLDGDATAPLRESAAAK